MQPQKISTEALQLFTGDEAFYYRLVPFEQTEKYKERIKKNRLTNDMILDYAEAMGYDVRNPDFWKSDNATYLEWSWIPVTKQNKP